VKNGAMSQTINLRVQRVPGSAQVPDTGKGVRRVWNLWTSGGGGLDSLTLYHSDSVAGSQYLSSQASINRYISPVWQTGPCPFSSETLISGLRVLGASSVLLTNTATSAAGNAFYSKTADMILPAIIPGANPSVCAGTTSTSLPYSGASGSPDRYSIVWNGTAPGQGFADVTNAALPASPFSLPVPPGAAAGIYTGTLTVRNSTTGCISPGYPVSVTVNALPTITPGINPSVCAGATSAPLPYTGAATGAPDQYSITWTGAAPGQGFADITNMALPASPISLAVPAAAVAGTYTGTLRVRNSTTGCVSPGASISVTINVVPAITLGSNPEVCYGAVSADLTYTGATYAPDRYSIDWGAAAIAAGFTNVVNTPLTVSAGSVTIPVPSAAAPGTYSALLTVGNATCGSSGYPFDMIIYPVPAAAITPSGPLDVCSGDSALLSAGTILPGHTYRWRNDLATVGGNTNSYAADTTGNYTVILDNGHCADTSAVVSVTWHPLPDVTILPGDAAFCEGGKVILQVPPGPFLDYQWKKDNVPVNGAQAYFLEADKTGVYKVFVSRNNILRCADSSAGVTVTVHPLPNPVVSWDGAVLRTDSVYVVYKWYRNGQLVSGANSFIYPPVLDGRYSVTVTDSNGCTGSSSSVLADRVGVSNVSLVNSSVRLYPNPTTGVVYIESLVPVRLLVSSMDGKSLLRAENTNRVDITDLPGGIYMMRIMDEHGVLLKVEKLTKN